MIATRAGSITSFHLRGSTTSTTVSISNSQAPKRRRAGRPTDVIQSSHEPREPSWRTGRFLPVKAPAAVVRVLRKRWPLDRLVQPLVIERAAHGRELIAKFLGRYCRDVSLVRALTFPNFNDREMVRPIALLEHVKTNGTRIFAAVRHQCLEGCDAFVLLRRRNVHMRHHNDGAPPVFSCRRRRDLHPRVYPIVYRADELWLDLLAEFLAVRGRQMRVVALLVLPDRYDRELIGWSGALQDVEARVALVLAAGTR